MTANRAIYHTLAAAANCDLILRDAVLSKCDGLPPSVKDQLRQALLGCSLLFGPTWQTMESAKDLWPSAPPTGSSCFQVPHKAPGRPLRTFRLDFGTTPRGASRPCGHAFLNRARTASNPNPSWPHGGPGGLADSLPHPPPTTSPEAPVGGRLSLHSNEWRSLLPDDPWVLNTISHGLRIFFRRTLLLRRSPVWTWAPADPSKAEAFRVEVFSLLQKASTEVVSHPSSPAFKGLQT